MIKKFAQIGIFVLPIFLVIFGVLFFCNVNATKAATLYVNYSAGNDTTGDGSSGNPWKTFTKGYASSTAGDTLDLTGTFTWTNADETGDKGASTYNGFEIDKEITIQGQGAGQTIVQGVSSGYGVEHVFTITNSASTTIKNLTIRNGYGANTGSSNDGGCIVALAGTNLTIDKSDLYNCQTWGWSGYGGIIAAYSTTTISNSSIHDGNIGYDGYGGGIYFSASGKTMNITNTTIYANAGSGLTSGGGIYVAAGTVNLTNDTIPNHTAGGVYLANSATVFLNLKNTIVAGNTSGYGTKDNIYKGSSATVTSNGYNIVGDNQSDSYFTATTGDWTDSNGDNTFNLYSIGTTGSLNLDTQGALNDNSLYTYTYGLLADSIAINNATTTAHGSIDIPATDQRSGARNGATDIGAFEYEASSGLTVITPTTQASAVTFSSIDYKQFTVSWTIGNGQKRAVFMKQASSGASEPADGTGYTANTVFGSGTQIGETGWYCIYNGYGTSVVITNLAQNTDYSVQVFEYNGINSGAVDYFTDTASNNPKVQTTHNPTVRYINYSTGNDSTGDGTSGNPWKTFTKGYASSIGGDTLDLAGTFTWTNADETDDKAYSTWTGFEIGKDLTIQGQGAGQTIVQGVSSGYGSEHVFTITNSASTTIKNITIRNGYAGSGGSYEAGGCIISLTGTNLTIDKADLYNCQTWGYSGHGGIIAAYSTTTITNSSIRAGNIGYSGYGGGIYFSATDKTLNITNTDFYANAGSGLSAGGAIYINAGIVNLTNTTVSGHTAASGIYLANSASAILNLKNSIIADNYTYYNYSTTRSNIYKGSSAIVTSNGYNVVGDNLNDSYFTATTGDWTDANGDGTYDLYSVGTTGSLNLDTQAALNDTALGTYTHRLLASSVAINNATTTANGSIVIPTTDQRGGARDGVADIGSFEYNAGGIIVSQPTTQATNIATSSVDYKQMTLSWTVGNGDRRVVFMKQASSGTASPVDGTSYTASAVFGSGTQIGTSGWYCIYNGFGTSVNVTNLLAATDYIVQVFEYNGVDESSEDYFTDTGTNNPKLTPTHTPVVVYVNYSTGNDTTGNGTSGSPYKTFTKGYTSSIAGDTLDLAGTFTWTNADETGDKAYSTWTGYEIDKDLTIQGQGAGQTIVQGVSSGYGSEHVFTITNSASTTIKNVTIRNGYAGSGGSYEAGGCIISLTGTNLTIDKSDLYNCQTWGYSGNGGIIAAYSTTTITNSSLHGGNNGYDGYGGGVYFSASGKTMNITNTTIYSNTGADYGGGIYINAGTINLTNSTITGHAAASGIYLANSASAIINLKNSIVNGNFSSGSTKSNIYKGSSATVTSNGYNIVGDNTNDAYFTATTGDWTDADGNETYTLYSVGTTGSLNLDTSAALNYSLYGTYTYALTASSSIAYDSANTSANNGVSIPVFDQRGAAHVGSPDIGAYEYGGTFTTTHTLTYVAGEHGSIIGSSTQVVVHGSSGEAVTATADSGYRFLIWSDGSTDNPRTDIATTSASFTASFELSTVTLTYSAGIHGSLTGSTTQLIDGGADGTAVTAVADEHYHFVNWSDGSTANPRTDTAVMSDVTVTANFSIDTFTVAYMAGSGGTITGSSTQIVDYASSTLEVVATPNTGYTFTSWDDASIVASRVDTNITTSTTYTASFTPNGYVLTYTAGTGGTISGTSTQVITHGANGTAVIAVPNTGYSFVSWSDASTSSSRIDTNVTGSASLTASFSINSYILSFSAGANGTLTGSTTQVVTYGSSAISVTAVPDSGYYFIGWSDGNYANPRTVNPVSANVTATANFGVNRTIYINSASGNDSTGTGYVDAPYKTFHKGYTVAVSGDTLDLTGTFTWTDTAETGDATLTGYTIAKNLTIQGQNADETIIQAAAYDNSAYSRVLTINSGITTTIKNVAIRHGRVNSNGIDGGGIRNSGILNISNCEIYNNRSLGDSGGGISNRHTLTIASSTIYNNMAFYMGGGVVNNYNIHPSGSLTITNSTIAYNIATALTAYTEGGGVHLRQGNGTITNSTIAFNTACGVGGVGMDSTTGILTIKNTIIARNNQINHSYCNSGLYPVDFGFRQSGYGNVDDNGYNIIGYSQHYVWSGTGDWRDAVSTSTVSTNRDGIFSLYGSSATSTLKLDTILSTNNNTYKTRTLALLSGSPAINNGATGTNGTVSVPAKDQRGVLRSGATDIGAFEYANLQADMTAPVISDITSVPGANTAVITWTTDEESTSRVKYDPNQYRSTATQIYNSGTMVTEHSVSLTGLIPCTKYYYAVESRDASGNNNFDESNVFYTTGCAGNSTIYNYTDMQASPSATTTITHIEGSSNLGLVVPPTFYQDQADFQIKSLNATDVMGSYSRPTGYNTIGTKFFDIKALADPATTIDTGSDSVAVSLTYTDDEVAGIDETTLKIYRSDGGDWDDLDNCVVDAGANTVTCDNSSFSVFGLFGVTTASADTSSSGGSTSINPSPPIIKVEPKIIGDKIIFEVGSAHLMAVSEVENFSGSSWEPYNDNYKNNGKILYIKFRSKEGGESKVYKVSPEGIAFDATSKEVPSGKENQFVSQKITNNFLYNRLKGKIILKVEAKGEAYYTHPQKQEMYYLGRPADAFRIMREQGIGITNEDLEKIQDSKDKYDLSKIDLNFTSKHLGKIFLQVEAHGEAWYVNPDNGMRYYLGRPADAFSLMRNLGLGISNNNFASL